MATDLIMKLYSIPRHVLKLEKCCLSSTHDVAVPDYQRHGEQDWSKQNTPEQKLFHLLRLASSEISVKQQKDKCQQF